MEFPKSIRVGQVVYMVTNDPDMWMQVEHHTQTKGYYGHTDNHRAIIYLNPETAFSVQRLTLWHEVLHAVLECAAGAPDWTDLGKDRDAREESVIRRIEAPTLNVLADNPELVKYLTAS